MTTGHCVETQKLLTEGAYALSSNALTCVLHDGLHSIGFSTYGHLAVMWRAEKEIAAGLPQTSGMFLVSCETVRVYACSSALHVMCVRKGRGSKAGKGRGRLHSVRVSDIPVQSKRDPLPCQSAHQIVVGEAPDYICQLALLTEIHLNNLIV